VKLGVALGGGSARGYAHIGALACLDRHGFAPRVIAGTSFGAFVGALYAAGLEPSDMTRLVTGLRRRDLLLRVADFGLHQAALFRGDKLEVYLRELLPVQTFAELQRELVIVTTDIDTGERILIKEGDIARALRASMALPGIFAPVRLESRRLIDGGLGSPVPLSTLDDYHLDVAVGIGVGASAGDSDVVRTIRQLLKSRWGRGVHQGFRRWDGKHPLPSLCRALAYTADTYVQADVGPGCSSKMHVQVQPGISWLHFHNAAPAIKAGDQALESIIASFTRIQSI
jgi:predicted acylesterase/phospholipase RssA